MNYYIIPKNNCKIEIKPILDDHDKIVPYISQNSFFYINKIYSIIQNLTEKNKNDEIVKYIHLKNTPFENIYLSNNRGDNLLKITSCTFVELIEIFKTFNIFESIKKQKNNILCLVDNSEAFTSEFWNQFSKNEAEYTNNNINTMNFNYNKIYNDFIKTTSVTDKHNLIILEFPYQEYKESQKYIRNLLLSLLIVVKTQKNRGNCIIKIDYMFYKIIVDILFIINSMYDSVYLIKPLITNNSESYNYLICNGYNGNHNIKNMDSIKEVADKINNDLLNDKYITSLIPNDLPYYFVNKLEEINLIMTHRLISSYDDLIGIYKISKPEEKIETLKNAFFRKITKWCDKHDLYYKNSIQENNNSYSKC